MKVKAWGIFCTANEVVNMKEALEKKGMDIFEVRPLTTVEKITYKINPYLLINEPHIVMFHATTLQYKWFLLKNRLTKVF